LSTSLAPNLTPTPFSGWALAAATALDLSDSPGLVSYLFTVSILKRQAAFVVLANVDLGNVEPFLSRLDRSHDTIGNAIRACRARDLIAAAFHVENVPTGYLRALVRVGGTPLPEPRLYRALYRIFSDPTEKRKAHALRYCGDKLTAVKIRAVGVLDPVLLEPEIVRHIHHDQEAHQLNLLIDFVRQFCSSASDQILVNAVRQAMGWGGLAGVARRFLKKADRCFPPSPLRWDPEIRYLDSGADFCSLALKMRNCLADRVAEALLGFHTYYTAEVTVAGDIVPVAIELSPLSDGQWKVEGVFGPKNKPIPVPQRKALVERLVTLGAILETNPRLHPDAKALMEPLNVHRWNELLPLEDKLEGDADEVVDLVLREIEREFGLT
jgi:hypothetical protein